MRLSWLWLPFAAACAAVSGLDDFTAGDVPANGGTGGEVTTGGDGGDGGDGGTNTGGSSQGGSATGGMGGSGPACTTLFDAPVNVCQLCEENNGVCILHCGTDVMMPSSGTCNDICNANGTDCAGAEDNSGICASNGMVLGCQNATSAEKLCFCEKTCGGGPKCAPTMRCNNGTCT